MSDEPNQSGTAAAADTAAIACECRIMRRRMRQMDKRLAALEQSAANADVTLARLNDYLDKEAVREAREQNLSLRRGVPFRFRPAQTSGNDANVYSAAGVAVAAAAGGLWPMLVGGAPSRVAGRRLLDNNASENDDDEDSLLASSRGAPNSP